MDEGFFRKATPQEHEAVVNNEKKQFSLNLIVRQKHSDKIKNGDYGVQTVMVIGRSSHGRNKRKIKVTFISEEGMMYIADVLGSCVKNMQDKDIGLLVMINETADDDPVDEYRFVPVSEYDPEYRQKPGAFSMKGTKPVFDPRKNKLDPRFYKVSNTEEYQTGDGLFTIHPESDTVIDHRLNRSPDKPDSADPENEPDKK